MPLLVWRPSLDPTAAAAFLFLAYTDLADRFKQHRGALAVLMASTVFGTMQSGV